MKTLKHIVEVVLTLAILIVAFLYVQHLLRPEKTDIAIQQTEVFHSLPENSVDVIVYGSSHAWRAVNVMEMYEKYGIGAYNYASFWQHFNTTGLYFLDSLETQTPKVVLIETYHVDALLQDTDMDGEIYYTRGLPRSEYKKEYLRQCFGKYSFSLDSDDTTVRDRYISYYVPLYIYHSDWTSINEAQFTDSLQGEDLSLTMGYHNVEATHGEKDYQAKIKNYKKFSQSELPQKSLDILDRIVDTCRAKGIEVVFFTTPYVGKYHYSKALKEYSETHGCAYIDLFEEMTAAGIDPDTDFYDSGHLNDQGARKEADYLAQYIKDHYDVADMRTVKDNLWETALKKSGK